MKELKANAELMRRVLRLARENAAGGDGGPFAALVEREGRVVAEGVNRVTRDLDPTAHAEVMAIRAACRELGSFTLEGCVLYTSCEPCPMCLGAALWARVEGIWWAATAEDAARAGFDDAAFYREVRLPAGERAVPGGQVLGEEGWGPFATWAKVEGRKEY